MDIIRQISSNESRHDLARCKHSADAAFVKLDPRFYPSQGGSYNIGSHTCLIPKGEGVTRHKTIMCAPCKRHGRADRLFRVSDINDPAYCHFFPVDNTCMLKHDIICMFHLLKV